MPRFLCYCPDYPDSLEKRMSVRPEHLKIAGAEKESGVLEAGTPFIPRPGTKARDAKLPAGTPNIAGSYMIYRFNSLEECMNRIKADVYWTAGVWDKERMQVEELME